MLFEELPIANDGSDIEAAVNYNARIRQAVNSMLAGIANQRSRSQGSTSGSCASVTTEFSGVLEAVKEHVRIYDPNVDALAYDKIKSIFASGFEGLKAGAEYDLTKGPEEIRRLAHDTIAFFKQHVENGNPWEELWIGDKPKKRTSRATHRLYHCGHVLPRQQCGHFS